MRRRSLLRAAGLATGATLLPRPAHAFVAAHNWDRYDWGTAPGVTHRLYQGSFPDDLVPRWDVVMAPTPSAEVVPNFGMGLVTYVWDEAGQKKTAKSLEQSIEELVAFPLGSLVYIRADWRHVHKGPGRLEPDPHWKLTFDIAKRHAKRVAFRVQLGNPNIPGPAMPDFVAAKVPLVKMGEWAGKVQYEPRYDHPAYQEAFADLVALLAEAYDGDPQVEYVDTMMYGFWGEGHTWPFEVPRHPFPDDAIAEAMPYSDNVIAHVKDVGGSLDPGYPLPGRIRQARFILPHGLDWKGLGLTAELEVKGVRRPVRWACRQRLEDGGALTLRPTVDLGDVL